VSGNTESAKTGERFRLEGESWASSNFRRLVLPVVRVTRITASGRRKSLPPWLLSLVVEESFSSDPVCVALLQSCPLGEEPQWLFLTQSSRCVQPFVCHAPVAELGIQTTRPEPSTGDVMDVSSFLSTSPLRITAGNKKRRRTGRSGLLSATILGANDGILSTSSLRPSQPVWLRQRSSTNQGR